jgi:hypothetical protein
MIIEIPPTADANALATMIAGTAAAAAAQTEVAQPVTPSATVPPTATVTSVPIYSTEGTALLTDAGGATTFIDQAGGYELKISPGWLLVRVNERELMDAWTLPETADARIQNFLHQVQKSDPKTFRLFGADTLAEHYQGGFVSNFNVFWDRDRTESLEQLVGALQEQLPRTYLNSTVTHAEVGFTSSRVSVGIVESSSVLLTPAGWPINLHQKQVVFHLKTGALTIVLSTTEELKDIYLPAFDAMVDKFALLDK